jgi:hypothetical protein
LDVFGGVSFDDAVEASDFESDFESVLSDFSAFSDFSDFSDFSALSDFSDFSDFSELPPACPASADFLA